MFMEETLIQIRDLVQSITVMCAVTLIILWCTILWDFFKDVFEWIREKKNKSKPKV